MGNNIRYTTNEQGADPLSGKRSPAGGWGEILLAALPFLLILLADGLPKLLVEGGLLTWEDAGMRILNTGLTVLLIGCLLAIFILAWRRRWPAWSATWYPFFCVPPLLLAVGLSTLLTQGRLDFTISQEEVIVCLDSTVHRGPAVRRDAARPAARPAGSPAGDLSALANQYGVRPRFDRACDQGPQHRPDLPDDRLRPAPG